MASTKPPGAVNVPHYGKPGNTLPADTQAAILDLCRQGVGRNEIGRRLDVSKASVSGVVQRAGLTFDRAAVETATRARTADLRARRAELSALLVEDAMRLRGQIWHPIEYIDHGGKDFDEARWGQDEPTPADKLKLMQAACVALGRHLNLEQHDAADGANDAASMLQKLGAALGIPGTDG